jgi:hypothetical protein
MRNVRRDDGGGGGGGGVGGGGSGGGGGGDEGAFPCMFNASMYFAATTAPMRCQSSAAPSVQA